MSSQMITRLSYPPRMSEEEAHLLVRLLRQIPQNAGWFISRPVQPLGSPPVFGAFQAKFVLPEGVSGEASGDTASEAFLKAWAHAHLQMAEKLMPKEPT